MIPVKTAQSVVTHTMLNLFFVFLQDKVIVIYSVDFLPQEESNNSELSSSSQRDGNRVGSSLDCPRRNDCSCCDAARDTINSTVGNTSTCITSSIPSHSLSQCRCALSFRAWGRVSLGMRVAVISASDLGSTVRLHQA